MGVINTVLGTIPTESLGITALHEHVAFGQNGWSLEAKWWKPASEIIQAAERNIGEYMKLGGRTYVDLTGVGMARDIDRFRVIAKSTGVNFVACTGFWTGTGVRPYFWDKPVEYFTDFFIKEITVGIDDTQAKAGVIKVGVSVGGLTELDEKLYRAAARAAVATGVPILTHLSTSADRQLDLVEGEGLSPDRIVIGHADAGVDVDFERDLRVARRGAYVGLDNIGYDKEKEPSVPWAQKRRDRLKQVLHMLDEGFADHLVVSADADCVPLGWVSPPHSVAELLDRFVPELIEEGTDDATIRQLLVGNPADLLTMREPAK
jgi:predicted metal-dependent phosphotriesterase family hydrolase